MNKISEGMNCNIATFKNGETVLYINPDKGSVDISYSHGNGHKGICDIMSTTKSKSEKEIAEGLKVSGYYLLGRTDKKGKIPEYITDAIDITTHEIVFVTGTKNDEVFIETLIFAKLPELNKVNKKKVGFKEKIKTLIE
ncbi:MAG: hypothetical protein PHZ26_04885 [Candidatus Gracilibacteria bacterium]|nr:hypothetical protein [Candidatus Gracilibacteria bacterium]MDD2909061.1 hypothetical protein [Candidatus Gracilibacteria bacterium]